MYMAGGWTPDEHTMYLQKNESAKNWQACNLLKVVLASVWEDFFIFKLREIYFA